MASRYAVATGNWNATATWSDSDGGAPGSSAPVDGDNVFLTATSGAITVTLTAGATCDNLVCTGFPGTLALGAYSLTATGDTVTLPSGMTLTANQGLLTCNAACTITGGVSAPQCGLTLTSGATYTLDSAGTTWAVLNIGMGNKTITLGSDLAVTSMFLYGYGTLTFSGAYDIVAANLYIGNGTLTLVLVSSRTLTASGKLFVSTASTSGASMPPGAVTIQASTASTATNLVYNGAVADCCVSRVVFTDVAYSGSTVTNLDNWYGGTLTRTSGITNRTSADIGGGTGGVTGRCLQLGFGVC